MQHCVRVYKTVGGFWQWECRRCHSYTLATEGHAYALRRAVNHVDAYRLLFA